MAATLPQPFAPEHVLATPARTWTLRLGALLFGLALLVGAELGLRAVGRYADPPAPQLPADWDQGVRLVGSHLGPPLEPATVEGAPGWQTSRRLVRDRFMHDLAWTTTPAPDTQRVFTFGGSSTYGVPVEATPERTFPGRMAQALDELGMRSEVINLGGASFGSDEVVALMQGVSAHGAAAWVVYAANNEFFQYQMELYEENRSYPTAQLHLQQLHLFRLLADLLGPGEAQGTLDDAVEQQERIVARVIEATLADPAQVAAAADGAWRRRDVHHQAVVSRYRANLEAMERLAEAAGARLFIVAVRPNLQQAPWLSLHDPRLSGAARRRVAALLADSATARAEGRAEDAAAQAEDAVTIDGMYADSWFALGMARLDLGDVAGAELALRNALELDMNPGRPVAGITGAIDAVTADGGSVRVSLDRIWADPTAGAFGGQLFHDSCHLTAEAQEKLGRHLAMTLRLELGEDAP